MLNLHPPGLCGGETTRDPGRRAEAGRHNPSRLGTSTRNHTGCSLTTFYPQGAWGGSGTKKSAPKPYLIKKVAGVDPKSRADYGKAHVIISEKKDKKAAKYMVKDLPYPYTSKAQFERSIETPLGPEWNTRVGFQRGTLPKVTKKVRRIFAVFSYALYTG